ncbi:MAG TPA: SGNH/GDSL hydrolase family protein, partial [Oligoflexia bacterium]|nr:SGNH/GDSL hydrolase family protein [Oligoflexia bacterium]
MKKKDLIFFGMFGFLSMTLALVVFEAGLRIFSVVPTVDKQYSAFRVDSEISYGHSPNTVSAGTAPYDEFVYEYRHNSQGFRDIEHPEKKEPGTFRILGLGDSFTYGAGAQFEDTYLAVVERELNNNNLNKRVEIIKAGISRSFPEHQRLVLKKYGPYYRPDLVIVGFTPNDIVDTHLSLNSIQVRPDGRLQIGSREPSVINDFLYRNSHVWRFIRFTIFRFSQRLHWKLMYDVEENKDAWKRILADYDDMAKLSRDLGAQMMIVVIPQS